MWLAACLAQGMWLNRLRLHVQWSITEPRQTVEGACSGVMCDVFMMSVCVCGGWGGGGGHALAYL